MLAVDKSQTHWRIAIANATIQGLSIEENMLEQHCTYLHKSRPSTAGMLNHDLIQFRKVHSSNNGSKTMRKSLGSLSARAV